MCVHGGCGWVCLTMSGVCGSVCTCWASVLAEVGTPSGGVFGEGTRKVACLLPNASFPPDLYEAT